ncbi:MAG: hypothetical protein Q8R28_10860, partial [Dehalococcoidia bacterium]|nr:hypothetical protein [Dehalococcoidia bacterium]
MPTHNRLWCLRRASNLEEDLMVALGGVIESRVIPTAPDNQRSVAMRNVFQQARGGGAGCTSWYEWVENFDPKWHHEDWRMQQLEEMRQANALKLA